MFPVPLLCDFCISPTTLPAIWKIVDISIWFVVSDQHLRPKLSTWFKIINQMFCRFWKTQVRNFSHGFIFSFSPVLLLQSHVLLIDGARQLWLAEEDGVVLDDHGLDKVINLWLPSDGVIRIQAPQEAGTEAHGQVVRLHHVFIAVLRHAGKNTDVSQHESWFESRADGSRSSLLVEEGEEVAHHDDEGPREGGNNRLDLGRFFCVVVDFWTRQGGEEGWAANPQTTQNPQK